MYAAAADLSDVVEASRECGQRLGGRGAPSTEEHDLRLGPVRIEHYGVDQLPRRL